MKNAKRSIGVMLLGFASAVCLSVGIGSPSHSQSALAEENDFAMVNVEARIDDKSGIRFQAELSASLYEEDAEYYMMIIPYGWFEEYGLTHGDDYYDVLINDYELENTDVLVMRSTPVKQASGNYVVSGSISNVLYKNSNREFFGVAYKVTENGERIYADNDERSVASMANAAVKAVNDKSVTHTKDEQTALDTMIRRAFNQLSGRKEDNQGELLFQTNTAKVSLSQGETARVYVQHAEALGFKATWKSSDESLATVDENGNVTALADDGVCLITANVYNQTCSSVFMLRPKMVENMLEDFSHEGSGFNLNNVSCIQGKGEGRWLAEFEGAQGVGVCTYSKNMNLLAVRFNRSVEYLRALEFDQITVRIYMDWEEVNGHTGEVKRTHALQIGTKHEYIPTKQWYDFTVTKNEILSCCKGNTAKERYENFCNTFANTGTGRALMGFHDGLNSIPIYIDSITFGFVDIEKTDLPKESGESFVIPSAKLTAGGLTLSETYTVKAFVEKTEIEILDGALIAQSGTHIVEYTFIYDGVVYKKTYTFDLS